MRNAIILLLITVVGGSILSSSILPISVRIYFLLSLKLLTVYGLLIGLYAEYNLLRFRVETRINLIRT